MWTLLLSRKNDPAGTFLDRRQIDNGEIRIGRSAELCDWMVPDVSGEVSREHCVISAIGFDLFVTDISTNGTALNQPGHRVAPRAPVAIRIGDRLLLGDYIIEVMSQTSGMAAPLQAGMAPQAAAQQSRPAFVQPDSWFDREAQVDPIWGSSGNSAEVHEFLGNAMHEFLAPDGTDRSGNGMAPSDPFAGPMAEAFSKPILSDPLPAGAAFAIPEDWASLPETAALSPSAPSPQRSPAALSSPDPFASTPARPTPPLTVTPDPWGIAPPANPFGDLPPLGGGSPDPFGSPVKDPLEDFDIPPVSPSRGAAAQGTTAPPAPVPAASDAKPAAPIAPSAPSTQNAPDANWAAFCEGAGIDSSELRTSPDAMRKLGILYRQVVLGLSDLIQDRAAFKDEFRVERTQLSFGRNNPIKYLGPLDSAKLLLADPMPGFMGSEDAVRAALEDIKRHQYAMLAGVQHALRTVFERLSPAEVKRMMDKAAHDKRGFGFGRGVNPWTVYQTMFEALRQDAASNVNSVMSAAFREGYEAFLRKGA